MGATHVVTGHYAQIIQKQTLDSDVILSEIHRGRDISRDQSYVLSGISPERLARMMLPIGGLSKSEVQSRADQLGLVTAAKPDSQEICFVPPRDHPHLVAHRLGGSRAGDIVDTNGTILGKHPGIEHFTIGQRQGLGIAIGSPLYVIHIDPETFRIVVGPKSELPLQGLLADEVSWVADVPTVPFECLVQCRA